jgi:hypothetical protein
MAGSFFQLEYLGDVRVLFQAFFPWVIPEDKYPILEFPDIYALSEQELAELQADIFPNIESWLVINSLLPFRTRELVKIQPPLIPVRTDTTVPIEMNGTVVEVPEQVLGVIEGLGYGLLGIADILERTVGGTNPEYTVFDNKWTWYRGSRSDFTLNWFVQRFQRAPYSDLRFLYENYVPRGTIGGTRLLTLHATRDPIVPIYHEEKYASRVTAAGRASFLRRIEVDAFGHGIFSANDLHQTFTSYLASPAAFDSLDPVTVLDETVLSQAPMSVR